VTGKGIGWKIRCGPNNNNKLPQEKRPWTPLHCKVELIRAENGVQGTQISSPLGNMCGNKSVNKKLPSTAMMSWLSDTSYVIWRNLRATIWRMTVLIWLIGDALKILFEAIHKFTLQVTDKIIKLLLPLKSRAVDDHQHQQLIVNHHEEITVDKICQT